MSEPAAPTPEVDLRTSRLTLGLSQEQLARRLGVSFATVNRWERGRTRPSGEMREAVAAVVSASTGRATGSPRGADRPDALQVAEERLLDRLSILPSSFSLEAAEVIAGARADGTQATLVLLGSLTSAGVVRVRTTPAGQRYELEASARSAGLARLAARGETDDARQRLGAWCARFAEMVEPGMRGPEQVRWLALGALEAPVMALSIEQAAERGDAALAVGLAGAFWRYWYSASELETGRRLLALALGARARPGVVPTDAARSRALLGAGVLARQQGDLDAAIRCFHEHLALARLGGDDRSIAQAHNSLAGALHQSGHAGRARQLLLASLDWWERTRDRQGMAAALSNLGVVASDGGELDAAREFGEQALALRLAIGNAEAIAISYDNLATVALRAGDDAEARRLFREALRRYAALDELDGVAGALDGLVLLVGDDVAAALLRLSDELHHRTGVPRSADAQARIERRRAELGAIPPEAALTLAAGVELALAATARDDTGPAARRLQARLTQREREVLALVTDGWTSKEIARRIGRSPRTVEHHLANVYAKVGARGRADAIAFGVRMGLGDGAAG